MKVFHRCVEAAKRNDIWVATTGPAFMEARLERRDLHITVSDRMPTRHPRRHLNACSLIAILTGESPVGLPATLKIPEGMRPDHHTGRREVPAGTRVEGLSARDQEHRPASVRGVQLAS